MTPLEIPGYTLGRLLGQGAFGEVYQALWNGDFPCAVKVLQSGALHPEYLGYVLERLMELPPHEGMLPVYAFDLEDGLPHVSMALMPEGSATFENLAGQLPRQEAWHLLRQLADCLSWLHSYGLVHAGLTGGNVFVVEVDGAPAALLSDLGQAWLGNPCIDLLHRQAPYFPPERWLDPARLLGDDSTQSKSWDVYAFGVLAWRFLQGTWPRAGRLFEQVLAGSSGPFRVDAPALLEWMRKEPPPHWPETVRTPAEQASLDLLLRCLALDPAERPPSMVEVAQFFHGLNAANPVGVTSGGTETHRVTDEVRGSVTVVGWGDSAGAPAGFEEKTGNPDAAAWPPGGTKRLPRELPPAEEVAPAGAMPWDALVSSVSPGAEGVFSGDGAHFRVDPPGEPGEAFAPQKDWLGLVPDDTEWHLRYKRGIDVRSPVLRRLAVAVAMLTGIGGSIYGLQQHDVASKNVSKAAEAESQLAEAHKAALEATSQASALGQARAADRLAVLSKSRNDWATLVADLVKSQPAEAIELEAWKLVAAPMADRLKAALAAADAEPSLASSGIGARWNLGELYAALDKPEESLPFLEQAARDLEMEAASGIEPDDAKRLLNNRISAKRGNILFSQNKTAEAVPLLTSASKGFEAWMAAYPDRHDIAREYAANSLREGRSLMERGLADESSAALSRIPALLGLPGSPGFELPDHLLLSDALAALAQNLTRQGKSKEAMQHYMDAIPVLIAYDRENPKSVACRNRLADHYFGLGVILSKTEQGDAVVALREAVKILTELSSESVPTATYRLAITYNEVAELLRAARPNAAGAKEALEYQNGSVTFLRNLNQTNTLDNSLRRQLAFSLVLNGELQETAGDFKSSLSRYSEAITLLDDLMADPALTGPEQTECRRLAARAWTATGTIQEKSGSKAEAIVSFAKAIDAWTGLPAVDPAEARHLASARERLKKLKPES